MINTRNTWHDEWRLQKSLIRQIAAHTRQSMSNGGRGHIVKHFIGNYIRGAQRKLTNMGKPTPLRGKYPREPELRETTTQVHDAWANMTLRYPKDEHEKTQCANAHART